MAIPDPLLDQEPFVEQETLVVTREWYSWLKLLVDSIAAALASIAAALETKASFEEGVFTPVLSFGGSTTGITYATQTGSYTKIHNTVYFSTRVSLSSKGSATGDALVSGLPFPNGAQLCNAGSSGRNFSLGGANGWMTLIDAGSSDIAIMSISASGNVNPMTDSDFTNTSDFVVTGFYLTGA